MQCRNVEEPSTDSAVLSHQCVGWEKAFASLVSKIKSEVHLEHFLLILTTSPPNPPFKTRYPRLALNSLCS